MALFIFGHLKKFHLRQKKTGTLNGFLSETGKLLTNVQGRNEGGKGSTIPRATNHYGGALRGAPDDCDGRRKVPTMSRNSGTITKQ